jgi:hypothetical protein
MGRVAKTPRPWTAESRTSNMAECCELELRRMGARATLPFEEPFLDVTSEYSDLGVNLVACEERCFEKTVIKRKQ